MNMNMNFMNGMFGKLKPGMCRMSIDGKIAVKTSNGYKTYDVTTGQLMNCDNFVFDIGGEFFFMWPTNKVQPGDIIVMAGKPHCVIKEEGNLITALRYEDSTISTVVPEHHMFMGKTYFYGKIVSMFGNMANSGPNEMMKYMAMAQMFGGNNSIANMQGNMLPMMFMMNGGFDKMFEGMFDAVGVNTPAAPVVKEDN
jgi:hypothetical protein